MYNSAHGNVRLIDGRDQSKNVIIDMGLYWMFKQAKKEYLFR